MSGIKCSWFFLVEIQALTFVVWVFIATTIYQVMVQLSGVWSSVLGQLCWCLNGMS